MKRRRSILLLHLIPALILALLVVVPFPVDAQLIGGPMLQQPRSDSVLVTWFTNDAVQGVVTLPESGRTFVESSATTDHAVRVTGLRPGTGYRYSVGTQGAEPLASGILRTTPPRNSLRPVRIVAFGDSGWGGENQRAMGAVINRALPNLLVHTGDIVYPDGSFSLYPERFFQPYSRVLRNVPFLPTVGNHDAVRIDDYRRVYAPPSPAAAEERYFSQRYGMVELISLDCMQPIDEGSAQLNWLKTVFRSSLYRQARWRIVFFHYPVFSAGRHGSTAELAHLTPLFEANGVDLVLNGHDHDYSRTGAVNLSGTGTSVTYVVTGGGGAQLYEREFDEPLIKKFEMRYHALDLRITESVMTVTAVGTDGKRFDRFLLRSRHGNSAAIATQAARN